METIVYRTVTDNSHTRVPDFDGRVVSEHASGSLGSAPQSSPLSPALFYPLVSAEEMTMWSYWLPTSITFETAHVTFPSVILSRLNRLHAPAPVLDEFLWAYNVGLFEAYEVMTPERQDLRDPLLLGRVGQQRYRMALWGESLRPLEEIADIVQQSLAVRQHSARWRKITIAGSALFGIGFGWWMSSQGAFEGNRVMSTFIWTLICSCFAWLPFLYTPASRQQDFLDQYRQ
jgi:hypothetical protein